VLKDPQTDFTFTLPLKATVKEEYQFCQGVGALFPCIDRQTSNFKPRRKMM
jgi:hypothetical protein